MWEKIYPKYVFTILLPLFGDLRDSNSKRIWKGFLLYLCGYSWQQLRQAKSSQRRYRMIDDL